MIDFEYYWELVLQFLAKNVFISIAITLALLIFLYKKPAEAVKFFGFCCLLLTVLYVMSLLTESGSTGASTKEILKSKSENAILE